MTKTGKLGEGEGHTICKGTHVASKLLEDPFA